MSDYQEQDEYQLDMKTGLHSHNNSKGGHGRKKRCKSHQENYNRKSNYSSHNSSQIRDNAVDFSNPFILPSKPHDRSTGQTTNESLTDITVSDNYGIGGRSIEESRASTYVLNKDNIIEYECFTNHFKSSKNNSFMKYSKNDSFLKTSQQPLQIESLINNATVLSKQVEELSKEKESLQNKNISFEEQIKHILAEKEVLNKNQTNLSSQVLLLQNQNSKLTKNNTDLQSQLKNQMKEIRKFKDEGINFKRKAKEEDIFNKQEIQKLNKEVLSLKAEVRILKEKTKQRNEVSKEKQPRESPKSNLLKEKIVKSQYTRRSPKPSDKRTMKFPTERKPPLSTSPYEKSEKLDKPTSPTNEKENKKSKYCVKYWQEITKPFAERKEANKHKNTIYKGFTLRLRPSEERTLEGTIGVTGMTGLTGITGMTDAAANQHPCMTTKNSGRSNTKFFDSTTKKPAKTEPSINSKNSKKLWANKKYEMRGAGLKLGTPRLPKNEITLKFRSKTPHYSKKGFVLSKTCQEQGKIQNLRGKSQIMTDSKNFTFQKTSKLSEGNLHPNLNLNIDLKELEKTTKDLPQYKDTDKAKAKTKDKENSKENTKERPKVKDEEKSKEKGLVEDKEKPINRLINEIDSMLQTKMERADTWTRNTGATKYNKFSKRKIRETKSEITRELNKELKELNIKHNKIALLGLPYDRSTPKTSSLFSSDLQTQPSTHTHTHSHQIQFNSAFPKFSNHVNNNLNANKEKEPKSGKDGKDGKLNKDNQLTNQEFKEFKEFLHLKELKEFEEYYNQKYAKKDNSANHPHDFKNRPGIAHRMAKSECSNNIDLQSFSPSKILGSPSPLKEIPSSTIPSKISQPSTPNNSTVAYGGGHKLKAHKPSSLNPHKHKKTNAVSLNRNSNHVSKTGKHALNNGIRNKGSFNNTLNMNLNGIRGDKIYEERLSSGSKKKVNTQRERERKTIGGITEFTHHQNKHKLNHNFNLNDNNTNHNNINHYHRFSPLRPHVLNFNLNSLNLNPTDQVLTI